MKRFQTNALIETIRIYSCWQNYVDYYKCVNARGEDFEPCKQFYRAFHSLCPNEWVRKNWNMACSYHAYLTWIAHIIDLQVGQ